MELVTPPKESKPFDVNAFIKKFIETIEDRLESENLPLDLKIVNEKILKVLKK